MSILSNINIIVGPFLRYLNMSITEGSGVRKQDGSLVKLISLALFYSSVNLTISVTFHP